MRPVSIDTPMLRIALTCDDAPTISAAPPHVVRDPVRMDRVRESLARHGVRHCVAFVIGCEAVDEGPLRRWREAGYELGNHTWKHEAASVVGVEAFLHSVARCDRLLRERGAFGEDEPKWFRFPYLDYGADEASRARIAEGLRGMGYAIAHATVDLYDDRFEQALGHAQSRHASLRTKVIGARYLRAANRALTQACSQLGPDVPQVPYFHFGGVSERFFGELSSGWIDRGAQLCSLAEALSHPALQRSEGTGLVLAAGQAPFFTRAWRRLQGLHNRIEPSQGRWLGPPWPRVRG